MTFEEISILYFLIADRIEARSIVEIAYAQQTFSDLWSWMTENEINIFYSSSIKARIKKLNVPSEIGVSCVFDCNKERFPIREIAVEIL